MGVVIPGVDSESFGFDPAGHLWVGAGSSNDLPNRYVGTDGNPVATSWSIQTHYAFNIGDLAVDTIPTALDSIKWDISTRKIFPTSPGRWDSGWASSGYLPFLRTGIRRM